MSQPTERPTRTALTSREERCPCPAVGDTRSADLGGLGPVPAWVYPGGVALSISVPGVPLGVRRLLPGALHLPFCSDSVPQDPGPPPAPAARPPSSSRQAAPSRPGGGHLSNGRGDSWAPNSGTNFLAPPVALRQFQRVEANPRGHVTAAGC